MKTGNLSLDQAPPEDIPFRYLLTGPAFGVLAGIVLAFFGERMLITAWDLDTVALTHLITLGWLTVIMMGAFYQMVPVLVGGHVPWIHLSRYTYYLFVTGILLLATGLLSWQVVLLLAALVLLVVALTVFIGQLLIALFRVKANRPVVYAMRISVLSLTLAMIVGVLMLGMMFGWWTFPIGRDSLKYIHLTLGLLGWVTLLIFGVSFHVIPMFYLTKSFPDRTAYTVISLIGTSLISLVVCFALRLNLFVLSAAALPALSGILLFLTTMVGLLRGRQRKMVDATLRFWQLGLSGLLPAFLLLPVTFFRMDEIFSYLFVLVFLLGFAGAISNGMLYKIIPFLVWLHRFSPLVGKIKTPAMKDIVHDAPARKQFYLFCFSLLLLIVAFATQNDLLTRIGGVAWTVSSTWLLYLLVKALRVVPPEMPASVAEDDFAALFKDLPPPPPKK